MDNPFIHELAFCESNNVGARTRIAAFAHVLANARIGADVTVCDNVFIEDGVVVGDRVTLERGVQLCSGVELYDDVFVGPNATFTKEPTSWSKSPSDQRYLTVVNTGASIGANATILAGIEIGRGAKVGAGAVITRSVPPNAIVVGNPAHIVSYIETPRTDLQDQRMPTIEPGTIQLDVRDVCLRRSTEFSDLRGSLTAGELPQDAIPFVPRRWFLVYDVPNREVRGEHAHFLCHQFMVCVSGTMTVAIDDGERRAEVTLDSPTLGLYVPPLVWASQFRYSADAVLLVLASHAYDASDYIRDYELFLTAATARTSVL